MMRDSPNWANVIDDMQPPSLLSSPFFTSHHQQQHSSPPTSLPQQSWAQHLDSFVGKDEGYRISSSNHNHASTCYDPKFSSPSKPHADADFDQYDEVFDGFYGDSGKKTYRGGVSLKFRHGMDMLDFSNNEPLDSKRRPSENGRIGGGKCKKTKAMSLPQPPLKVRKEKLGDRITALHQLVSPFGKTDTASVLLEAVGYIRFLQGQIEALSSPYVRKPRSQQYSLEEEEGRELRGKGLCLVPIPYTGGMGDDNWCTAIGGGGGGEGF